MRYLCVKSVEARLITLGEYNILRGWVIPADEDPAEVGYLVEDDAGRLTYVPKDNFESSHHALDSETLASTSMNRIEELADIKVSVVCGSCGESTPLVSDS